MSMRMTPCFEALRCGMLMGAISWSAFGVAQGGPSRAETSFPAAQGQLASDQFESGQSVTDAVRELREQVRELQMAVDGMRSECRQAHAETAEMRRELDELRGSAPPTAILRDAVARSETASPAPVAATLRDAWPSSAAMVQNQVQREEPSVSEHRASLEEEYQLLSGKVDDQYQTKVESASKYRLRISGIVLMNLFSNQGVVDDIDLPMITFPRPPGDSGGSFGATLRQSEIGFETFGPTVAGAKTRGDLQLDLAGGFPSVPNGIDSGLVRLRTATMRMDWTNTSVVAGQDAIFIAPNSPTSFASLAIPALSAAGNLWAWVPQVRVEHRVTFGEDSSLMFQGGIFDPVSGEVPNDSYRYAGPGEESRQPAFAARMAWSRNIFGQPLRLGAGGYYSRQDYGFNRNIDGWAGTADISLPLSPQFLLSGAFYRGRAIGGLYAGFGRSVLFSGDPASAYTQVQGLDCVGGWAQLKYRPANKWEFNAAFGMDNPYASDLKYFPYPEAYGGPLLASLARNQGSFVNMIYRPRSDLLFSAEYRHLTTYSISDAGASAGHLNLMMGFLF